MNRPRSIKICNLFRDTDIEDSPEYFQYALLSKLKKESSTSKVTKEDKRRTNFQILPWLKRSPNVIHEKKPNLHVSNKSSKSNFTVYEESNLDYCLDNVDTSTIDLPSKITSNELRNQSSIRLGGNTSKKRIHQTKSSKSTLKDILLHKRLKMIKDRNEQNEYIKKLKNFELVSIN